MVHVIRFPLEGGAPTDVVSDAERLRAARLLREVDRRRYLAAHAITRTVLALLLNVPPKDVHFETGAHGKPRLAGESTLTFNLSHSGDCGLLAVAAGCEVGVDIEQQRPIDLMGIARHSFSPCEFDTLSRYSESLRVDAFYRCWTRKEAVVKAHGSGLSCPLNSFTVDMEPGVHQFVELPPSSDGLVTRWRIVPLAPGSGFCAAVAFDGERHVRLWTARRGAAPVPVPLNHPELTIEPTSGSEFGAAPASRSTT
jgi:4'-phosphopantetheinyl transferase